MDKQGGDGLILIGLGGFGYILGPYLGVSPIYTIGFIALGGLLTGLELYMLHESKYEKLFKNCGIVANDKSPLVIKKTETDGIKTLVVHMPEGISQKHFENRQQELEQATNSKIEYGFNKNLILKLTEMNLKTMYPFVFQECEKPLEICIGYTYSGRFILDIEKCPHTILAGETGGGKSSLLDIIALSIMQSKFDVDLHLIDFQAVGLGKYENCKKVKSYGETVEDFEKLLDEMEKENNTRMKLFRSVKKKVYIDKLSTWNKHFPDRAMPYKVVLIDEFAKLSDDIYKPVLDRFRSRANMDRKVGIHYVISLQRPDVKCIEGSIKANFPARIAFKTVTDTDSEVILDVDGAEKLKNPGRCLIKYDGEIKEVQCMYIDSEKIRGYLKRNDLFAPRQDTYIKEQKIEERQRKIREFHTHNANPY